MCCCFQWCTDVILTIRHYPNLCRDICFVTGVDKKHRNTTCPNLQCFGCNEGCISPWFPYTIRGRRHWTICWQGKADFFFLSVGRIWPRQWQSTGTFKARAEHLSEAPINVIEALVCQLYLPHTELTNGANASWWLFKEKQVQWAPLPSFTSSSYNASPVYEAMTWYNDGIPNPGLPQPVDYG